MATNKTFHEDEKGNAQNEFPVRVCPRCKKTAHYERRYCACHQDLRQEGIMMSETPPEIGLCNFETPNLSCHDCPETCTLCYSFAVTRTNERGYGGKDCRYRNDSVRCGCCQAQIKIGEKLDSEIDNEVNIAKFTRSKTSGENPGLGNYFEALAEFSRAELEKPVRARIAHYFERAG